MKSVNQLDALVHISKVIKAYCRQTADYRDPAHNASISFYLKQHLSSRHWKFWQSLQPGQQAAIVYNQDSLPDDALSLQEFRLRLQQYKRSGYELFKFWHQVQQTPLTE